LTDAAAAFIVAAHDPNQQTQTATTALHCGGCACVRSDFLGLFLSPKTQPNIRNPAIGGALSSSAGIHLQELDHETFHQ
jgi:hypothetical protein